MLEASLMHSEEGMLLNLVYTERGWSSPKKSTRKRWRPLLFATDDTVKGKEKWKNSMNLQSVFTKTIWMWNCCDRKKCYGGTLQDCGLSRIYVNKQQNKQQQNLNTCTRMYAYVQEWTLVSAFAAWSVFKCGHKASGCSPFLCVCLLLSFLSKESLLTNKN